MLELCSLVRCISIYISFQSLNYFNYDIGEGQGSLKILIYLIVEYIFTGFVYIMLNKKTLRLFYMLLVKYESNV